MKSKVVLGAIAAVGIAASILAHPGSSRASEAPISARAIFDETLGSRIAQSLPAREATKRTQLIAAVENQIAAHDPAFFNRFGDDMTSGDPHRVSGALSHASALIESRRRVALRPDALTFVVLEQTTMYVSIF